MLKVSCAIRTRVTAQAEGSSCPCPLSRQGTRPVVTPRPKPHTALGQRSLRTFMGHTFLGRKLYSKWRSR